MDATCRTSLYMMRKICVMAMRMGLLREKLPIVSVYYFHGCNKRRNQGRGRNNEYRMKLNNVVGIHIGALIVVLLEQGRAISIYGDLYCPMYCEGGRCNSCRYVVVISNNPSCQNLRGKFVCSQFLGPPATSKNTVFRPQLLQK